MTRRTINGIRSMAHITASSSGMTALRGGRLSRLSLVNGRRLAFGAGSQLRVPPAHQASVLERGVGELLDRGGWVSGGTNIIPVQDVLPQRLVPSSRRRGQAGSGEPGRCRVSEREERRLLIAGIPRPPANL